MSDEEAGWIPTQTKQASDLGGDQEVWKRWEGKGRAEAKACDGRE